MKKLYRLGCDIGGTFTDFALVEVRTGSVYLEKCLTTPDDPGRAVLEGLARLTKQVPDSLGALSTLIHGTTLVINTLLERKGARTALITTEGIRDVLEMRKEQRYDKYDLFQQLPQPLVPRHLRIGVTERMHASGTVLKQLDVAAVERVADELKALQVESVAVCLLHSYANPVHERMIRDIVAARAPGVLISLSSDVLPEIREYERFSTTAVNAYVQPRVARYLSDLDARLRSADFTGQVYLLSSEGGLTSVDTARRLPVRIVESGPAGGVIATQHWSRKVGARDFVSFDMGGTTAKVCVVTKGRAALAAEYEVARAERFKRGSGIPIQVPTVDLLEVGSGGGSIAQLNRMGLLQVGPESAGANPGPACYGLGSDRPTVTDADLTLGYLDPKFFLGGRMRLDRQASINALEKHIASPLGRSAIEAAWGIFDLVNENMTAAARAYLLERGQDPTSLPIFAYGGAGPVHAYRVARKLGAPALVIPPGTGALSALGFLVAEPAIMVSQTHKVRLGEIDWMAAAKKYEALEKEAVELLPRGFAGALSMTLGADMRYVGQGYSIEVIFHDALPGDLTSEKVVEEFSSAYRAIYGRTYDNAELEFLNLRLRVSLPPPEIPFGPKAPDGGNARKGDRQAYFPECGGFVACPVYDRYRLAAGQRFDGPAIIEEVESTTVVGADAAVTVHESGALWVDLKRA